MNRHEWLQAVIESGCSSTALRVANGLWTFMDSDAVCFPKQQALADRIDASTRTVREGLAQLEELGFLDKTRGRFTTCYEGRRESSGDRKKPATHRKISSGDRRESSGLNRQISSGPPIQEPNQENLNDCGSVDEAVVEVCRVFEAAGMPIDNWKAHNIVANGRACDVAFPDIRRWVTDSLAVMTEAEKFTKANMISALQKPKNVRRWKQSRQEVSKPEHDLKCTVVNEWTKGVLV